MRLLKYIQSSVYFATTPWANVLINAWWHRRFSRRYIPKVLHIETTNLCNARCVMCPHEKMQRPQGIMPWETFTKIIDDCKTFEGRGLVLILHKDGEPLLDPLLCRRIGHIRATLKKSKIMFSSNGAALTEKIADELLRCPPDQIGFSVDGASAATYESIRTGLRYATVVENIHAFLAKRKASGAKVRVVIQMVTNLTNQPEHDEYLRIWGPEADEIVFKDMHNFLVQGTSVRGAGLYREQKYRCIQPFTRSVIYWNGDLALCCWDCDHAYALGNVMDKDLVTLFNQPAFDPVRRAMARKECKGITLCNVCTQIYGEDNPLGVRRRPADAPETDPAR
ncbi:MAG: radical SAM/SPASM domain-containing protein [Kiritimatiellae bacterium]|nr:radical SAM/SPASM domain-containing protein [Kiritimatiellia bacterium]